VVRRRLAGGPWLRNHLQPIISLLKLKCSHALQSNGIFSKANAGSKLLDMSSNFDRSGGKILKICTCQSKFSLKNIGFSHDPPSHVPHQLSLSHQHIKCPATAGDQNCWTCPAILIDVDPEGKI
jgi:hypothetical protein